jgi:hypothetical protein
MLMEAVKYVLLDTLVANSSQHVIQKYALAIIFFSCIHFGSDWNEQNHHLLNNPYFQLLPRFYCALHFGMLPWVEPSSDAQWFDKLMFALSFWNLRSCFLKLLRNHKLSFNGLFVFSYDQEVLTT